MEDMWMNETKPIKWLPGVVRTVEIQQSDEYSSDDDEVKDYLRLKLDIDRRGMPVKDDERPYGDDEVVVLMKNPSEGTGEFSDKTLDKVTKYMPRQFGIIHCVNVTPVVTSDPEYLTRLENVDRMKNPNIQEKNIAVIKNLLTSENVNTLILATGKLDDMANLRTIYQDLVADIKAIRMETYFEIKWFNQTRDKKLPTGCHPGYKNPSERPKEDDPARLAYVQYIGNDEKGERTPGKNPEMFEYILDSVEDEQLIKIDRK